MKRVLPHVVYFAAAFMVGVCGGLAIEAITRGDNSNKYGMRGCYANGQIVPPHRVTDRGLAGKRGADMAHTNGAHRGEL